ncbi:MAG: E3 binding domain-containing protein, partial [Candidatus Eremiobacteraeota bacterium]|nr:E3 binding domain-containing protein [Candidatus Eremiobacteraeota bacterium]
MPTTITMPQLGETVTEGTVAQWLKKPGDSIEKYEAFVEVSTDKVNAEVPSPVTGRLSQLLVKEGETVATGTPIAVIDEGEALSEGSAPAQTQPQTEQRLVTPSQPPERTQMPATSAGNGAARDGAAALRGASPAVRRLAREHHIDITTLRGSGQNGRVTVDDVMAAARMGPAAAVGQAVAASTAPPQAPTIAPAAAQAPTAQAQPTPQAPPTHPPTSETSTYAAPRLG